MWDKREIIKSRFTLCATWMTCNLVFALCATWMTYCSGFKTRTVYEGISLTPRKQWLAKIDKIIRGSDRKEFSRDQTTCEGSWKRPRYVCLEDVGYEMKFFCRGYPTTKQAEIGDNTFILARLVGPKSLTTNLLNLIFFEDIGHRLRFDILDHALVLAPAKPGLCLANLV